MQRLLHLRLKDDDRIVGDKPPDLRTPPIDKGDPRAPSPAVRATVFPRWFACDAIAGDAPNRRRLVRFQDLEAPKRAVHVGPDGKKRKASPIRFVCGCENGHLQDIDWRRVVHQNVTGEETDAADKAGACRKPMWLEDSGTSADPRDTRVVCECGASLSLEELFQPGPPRRLLRRTAVDRFERSRSERLRQDVAAADAQRDEHLLSADRSGHLASAGSRRPRAQSRGRLDGHQRVQDRRRRQTGQEVQQRRAERTFRAIPTRKSSLAFSQSRRGAARTDEAEDPKIAEYQLLASGRALIGVNSPDAHLHAETLPRAVWDPDGDPELAGIGAVVAVHRLREVACLYGFTRFEPAPLASDDLEDVGLAVRGAPLGQSPDWLPAIEQFGEGIFIQFSSGRAVEMAQPARRPSSAPDSSRQASRSGPRQSVLRAQASVRPK